MTELEKKIQLAKTQRENINGELSSMRTSQRIKEAELRLIDHFIDQLNDLKARMDKENKPAKT